MTYRINRINYQLIPRFNISSPGGVLPVLYTVPVISNKLPAATTTAFNNFANNRVQVMDKTFKGSFIPYAYSDSA